MKLVTYSVFPSPAKNALRSISYLTGVMKNVELVEKHYPPGWGVAAVLDESFSNYGHIFESLGVRVAWMPPGDGYSGTMWRITPAAWPGVVRVASRDADSEVTDREGDMVRAWEESGKPFHLIHDHPQSGKRSLRAGMWGAVIDDLIRLWASRMPMAAPKASDDELMMCGILNHYEEDQIHRSGDVSQRPDLAREYFVGNRKFILS